MEGKMITLVIPYHNEDLSPLLMSVATQQRVNWDEWEVVVVTDDKEPQGDFYGLPVRVLRNEKAGYMGVSRQIGIDAAKGEWLLFADADDMFYMNTLFFDLRTRINDTIDLLSFKFIEELPEGYIVHEPQVTWMFAKLYRRAFLVRNNVRFHDDLLWHEDTYFHRVMMAYRPRVEYLDYVGYIWRYGADTITRRNKAEYTTKSVPMYIDALDKSLDRMWQLQGDRINEVVTDDVGYIYCQLNSLRQRELRDECIGVLEQAASAYIKKWGRLFAPARVDLVTARIKNADVLPCEGFEAWYKRLYEL